MKHARNLAIIGLTDMGFAYMLYPHWAMHGFIFLGIVSLAAAGLIYVLEKYRGEW